MLQSFSQTRAAVVLEKLSPISDIKCINKQTTFEYLKNLCKACIVYYAQFREIDAAYKSYIIFSFTNSSYFMIDGFNSSVEDQVVNDCIVEQNENIEDAILGKLFPQNHSKGFSDNEFYESYFGMSIDEIFNDDNEDSEGLGILFNSSGIDLSHIPVPNREEELKNDYFNNLLVLKSKSRILSKNEFREFLIYHTIYLFQDYRDNGVPIPEIVMEKIYSQISNVAPKVFGIDYSLISPEKEISENHSTENIFLVKDKYFSYLHNF